MIVRYQKQLDRLPDFAQADRFSVREYASEADQMGWIGIHQRAFGHQKPWTRDRFASEFLDKEWWEPRRMLLAIDSDTDKAVGTITLGEKACEESVVGTVAWLAVLPEYRRRGIGRLLTMRLEALAVQLRYQLLELETLSEWVAANRLYAAMGWQSIDSGA